jgi:hypothetical protein
MCFFSLVCSGKLSLSEFFKYKSATVQPKKIYRLKEDQAFSLSLELGRREKVAWHPSADFLLPSVEGGWRFCRYCYCGENNFERDER